MLLTYCFYKCQLTEDTNVNEHLHGRLAEHLTEVFSRLKSLHDRIGEVPVGNQTVTVYGRLNELEQRFSSFDSQAASSTDQRMPIDAGTASSAAAVAASSASKSVADSAAAVAEFTVEKLPIIEGVITVLNRELEKMSVDMEALDRQRRAEKELVDNIDRKVRLMERLIAMKDVTINELNIRLTSMEQTSHDGTLLWRVSDVKAKRQDALSGRVTSVYSPPFFTSRTGRFTVFDVVHCCLFPNCFLFTELHV